MKLYNRRGRLVIELKKGDCIRIKSIETVLWRITRLPRKNGVVVDTQFFHLTSIDSPQGNILLSPDYVAKYAKKVVPR